jgi:hypothetical protein
VSGKRGVTLSAVEESVTLSAVEESAALGAVEKGVTLSAVEKGVTLSEARGLLPKSGHHLFVSTDLCAPSRCNDLARDRASVPSLRSE